MENFKEKFLNISIEDLSINLAEIVTGILAFFGNFFILFLWLYCKKLRVKRNSYLISLSIANIFMSIFAIPLTIFTHHGFPNNIQWCLFEISTIISIRSVVIFGIVAISIDRLLAVKAPFEYRSDARKTITILIIISCWLMAFTFGYSIMFLGETFEGECKIYEIIGRKQLLVYSVVGQIIPALTLIIIYAFIFCSVKKVTQNMKKFANLSKIQRRKRRLAQKKELRATFKITAIVATFLICEMPSAVTNILCVTKIIHFDVSAHQITLALVYLQSAICPFIYAFNLRDFRSACQELISKKEKNDLSFSSKLRSMNQLQARSSSDSEEFSGLDDEDSFDAIAENQARS